MNLKSLPRSLLLCSLLVPTACGGADPDDGDGTDVGGGPLDSSDGGGETGGPDAAPDASGDASDAHDGWDAGDSADAAELDDSPDADAPPPGPARLLFELDVAADASDPPRWFDFPWPSDLRLHDDGTLEVSAMPNGARQPLYTSILETVEINRGFPLMPVAWFRFSAPIAPASLDLDAAIAPSTSGPAILINIDADSPHLGEMAPLTALSMTADFYTPENVLALAPFPGWVLDPGTKYAFVVLRSWGDADGAPLEAHPVLSALLAGEDPELDPGAPFDATALGAHFAPLVDVLDDIGVGTDDVAAATVFTTGDPAASLFELTEWVRREFHPQVANLEIDPDDGDAHPRYCELHGTLDVPEFQEGRPPFDTGGLFLLDEDGHPILQRTTAIPVVVNLPRIEMPAEGFPLVLYFHGSGGLSTQVVDRGPEGTTGEGPAHVLAGHGLASAGSAHPVNPERLPGASDIAYINFGNLRAFRDTFRQGVLEQRLYLDALLSLRVSPEDVAACDGIALPSGADTYFFDPQPIMAMGQSMGGMYTNLVSSVEPRIEAIAPTGSGGYWSYFILRTELIPGAADLLATIIRSQHLSHVHPVLHMLEAAWETAEPFNYVPRLSAMPLPGHPARSIYEPAGEGDHYFPTIVYDAISLAHRNPQAGEVIWDETRESLAWRGLDTLLDYPVRDNLLSEDGRPYTGAIVQWPGDGIHDPHEVFQYYPEVKHQYGCFFETFYRTGHASIVAPAETGTPCE